MRVEFTAGPDDEDRRLESVLRRFLPHQPLGSLHKALRRGDIRLNNAKATPDTRVIPGDKIGIWDALLPRSESLFRPPSDRSPTEALPQEWIIFQNEDWLVINKPSGLLVHAGENPRRGEVPLDERVRAWLADSQRHSLGFRPGPLHRLDRETSGLVVFSRTLVGARQFSSAMIHRKITKTYLAVLSGFLDSPREVHDRLIRDGQKMMSRTSDEGVEAVSRFVPLAWIQGLTLAEVELGTGRTHQIRVHAQSLGHSLAGDRKYGGGAPPDELDRPWLLHAWKLSCDLFPAVTAPLEPRSALWVKKKFKFVL